jgi:23S rRNA U2552 (ribose-2'-O)-methylase RlmE/FtsJ
MQVAAQLIGDEGVVVGVDLHEVRLRGKNLKAIEMDVHDPRVEQKVLDALGNTADVALSDLAPSVSGVWELDQGRQVDLTLRVLELCESILRRGGSGFFKLFEGERSQEVRDEFRKCFRVVHTIKPLASRSVSSELYYYCEGWSFPGTRAVTDRLSGGDLFTSDTLTSDTRRSSGPRTRMPRQSGLSSCSGQTPHQLTSLRSW